MHQSNALSMIRALSPLNDKRSCVARSASTSQPRSKPKGDSHLLLCNALRRKQLISIYFTRQPLLRSHQMYHALTSRATKVRTSAAAQQPGQRTLYELRICTNTSCRKQGAQQVLKFAQDLGLDELEVKACGCLGACGNGPNLAILPQEHVLRHVSTPADFADVVRWQCNVDISPQTLKATELRLAGNALARSGDVGAAVQQYHAALKVQPQRGQHLLHSNLAAAYLQLGEKEAALEHARLCVEKAPRGFHNAYIRLVDSLYALGQFEEAAAAVQDACRSHPGFACLPEYKVIQQALAKEGVTRRVWA